MRYLQRQFFLSLFVLLLIPTMALAGDFPDQICADCHQDTGGEPAEVSSLDLVGSMHEDLNCTDCHVGITSVPHAKALAWIRKGAGTHFDPHVVSVFARRAHDADAIRLRLSDDEQQLVRGEGELVARAT